MSSPSESAVKYRFTSNDKFTPHLSACSCKKLRAGKTRSSVNSMTSSLSHALSSSSIKIIRPSVSLQKNGMCQVHNAAGTLLSDRRFPKPCFSRLSKAQRSPAPQKHHPDIEIFPNEC